MTNSSTASNTKFEAGTIEYYLWITAVLLSFTCGIACLVFNTITLTFYKKKVNETLSLMYTALSTCDMMAGVSALLNGVSLLIGPTDIPADDLFGLYKLSIFCTSLTSHCSVFYNTVLVIVRTINLMFPFFQTRNCVLKLSFIIYPLIWVIITSIDIAYYHCYTAPSSMYNKVPNFFLVPLIGLETVEKATNYQYDCLLATTEAQQRYRKLLIQAILPCIIIPYVVPAVISVTCFVLQANVLLKKGRSRDNDNQRITMTILYLTAVFFVCNSAYFITGLVVANRLYSGSTGNNTLNYTNPHNDAFHSQTIITCHLVGVILQFMNSALNPIILISRGRDLKTYIKNVINTICTVRPWLSAPRLNTIPI